MPSKRGEFFFGGGGRAKGADSRSANSPKAIWAGLGLFFGGLIWVKFFPF